MSSKTSSSDDRKCCSKCGIRRSASVNLSKCSRCLTVKYCSRECQTLHWKRHKKAECTNKSLPTGAARQAISFSPEVVASSLFRAVLVQDPKDAFSCYTRMRLYSVDKAWRNDYDYVVFSILRCAAYGVEGFRDLVRQLPTPTALNQAPNLSSDQMRMVSLLPDFQ